MTAIPENMMPGLDLNENLKRDISELLKQEPIPNATSLLVEDMIGTPMIDLFKEAADDIDAFEETAWQLGEGYTLPNYKHVTDNLEGVGPGLYICAGPSNAGKSAIMMNMVYDACMHEENNLFGLYFSLDDSRNEIIPRVVAMDQSIPISVVGKPARYRNYIEAVNANGTQESDMDKVIKFEEYLMKRSEGLNKLKDNANRFKVEDSTRCTTLNQIENFIKNAIEYIKTIDEEMNLIVAIDSINDIQLDPEYKSNSNNDRIDIVSKTVKHWTVKYNLPIFASTHLRKLNGNRRPTIDDLKESNTLVYEASVIWLVYNDVSANKQGAKIFYAEEVEGGVVEKKPIIELDWAKNKKSSYKGLSFCFFSPEHSKATECLEEQTKRYSALIYQS